MNKITTNKLKTPQRLICGVKKLATEPIHDISTEEVSKETRNAILSRMLITDYKGNQPLPPTYRAMEYALMINDKVNRVLDQCFKPLKTLCEKSATKLLQ